MLHIRQYVGKRFLYNNFLLYNLIFSIVIYVQIFYIYIHILLDIGTQSVNYSSYEYRRIVRFHKVLREFILDLLLIFNESSEFLIMYQMISNKS